MAKKPVKDVGSAGSGAPHGESFLIDKSAWEQRRHSDLAKRRIDDLATEGKAATCLPIALEQLYSARNRDDFNARRGALGLLVWLPLTEIAESAAIEIMSQLAGSGHHRMPLPDIMIAATAQAHQATILHYDRDFERIASVTGQPHEWIIPRGRGHGREA